MITPRSIFKSAYKSVLYHYSGHSKLNIQVRKIIIAVTLRSIFKSAYKSVLYHYSDHSEINIQAYVQVCIISLERSLRDQYSSLRTSRYYIIIAITPTSIFKSAYKSVLYHYSDHSEINIQVCVQVGIISLQRSLRHQYSSLRTSRYYIIRAITPTSIFKSAYKLVLYHYSDHSEINIQVCVQVGIISLQRALRD